MKLLLCDIFSSSHFLQNLSFYPLLLLFLYSFLNPCLIVHQFSSLSLSYLFPFQVFLFLFHLLVLLSFSPLGFVRLFSSSPVSDFSSYDSSFSDPSFAFSVPLGEPHDPRFLFINIYLFLQFPLPVFVFLVI